MSEFTVKALHDAVAGSAAALRSRVKLQPAGGEVAAASRPAVHGPCGDVL